MEIVPQTVTDRLRQAGGETGVLRGEEFKRYVTKLRGRSSVYKRSRAELAGMKAEAGVLARTLDILRARLAELGTQVGSKTVLRPLSLVMVESRNFKSESVSEKIKSRVPKEGLNGKISSLLQR
jgi:hypothetical protein